MPGAYCIYFPDKAGNIAYELKSCLNEVLTAQISGYRPVKMDFFIDMPDFSSFLQVLNGISDQGQKK
jgi:hypothetical protein